MRVLGVDFTSSPGARKALTCVVADLEGEELSVGSLERWRDFDNFERALMRPGPWIAALDFPFGQSSAFTRNIGWPRAWSDYVSLVGKMSRKEYRERLDAYRETREPGDKEHRRKTDVLAGSSSPQKLFGVPVGLMFYEGAPRLLASGVTVPGIIDGDPKRIAVEAYPGALARHLIGRRSYKNDSRGKQTADHGNAREEIVTKLRQGDLLTSHGVRVDVVSSIAEDPGADDLDALLCAVQAAAAWRRRDRLFGAPAGLDPNEGWIAEPSVYEDRDRLR